MFQKIKQFLFMLRDYLHFVLCVHLHVHFGSDKDVNKAIGENEESHRKESRND